MYGRTEEHKFGTQSTNLLLHFVITSIDINIDINIDLNSLILIVYIPMMLTLFSSSSVACVYNWRDKYLKVCEHKMYEYSPFQLLKLAMPLFPNAII